MLFRKLLRKEKKTQDALDSKTIECKDDPILQIRDYLARVLSPTGNFHRQRAENFRVLPVWANCMSTRVGVMFMRKARRGRSRSAETREQRTAATYSFYTRGINQRIMLLATIQTSSRESHYSVTATPVYSTRQRKENPASRLKKKIHVFQCIVNDHTLTLKIRHFNNFPLISFILCGVPPISSRYNNCQI